MIELFSSLLFAQYTWAGGLSRTIFLNVAQEHEAPWPPGPDDQGDRHPVYCTHGL